MLVQKIENIMSESKELMEEEEVGEAGKIMRMITEGKNPRGIPQAKFIVSSYQDPLKMPIICHQYLKDSKFIPYMTVLKENVPEFLTLVPIEPALGALNDLYSKYKYMEQSFEKSKSIYKSKVPEVSQSIELIEMMVTKRDAEEEMVTHYSLCDTVFTSAKVLFAIFV